MNSYFSILILSLGTIFNAAFLLGSCNGITASESKSVGNNAKVQQTVSIDSNLRKWITSEWNDIKPGITKRSEVIERFGEPKWAGKNAEKVYPEDSEEQLLQYRNIQNFHIDIIVDDAANLVKALTLYPAEPLTRERITKEYGTDYFEIESSESLCIDSDRAPGPSGKPLSYPVALVYPNKGLYISLERGDRVNHIGYLVRCV